MERSLRLVLWFAFVVAWMVLVNIILSSATAQSTGQWETVAESDVVDSNFSAHVRGWWGRGPVRLQVWREHDDRAREGDVRVPAGASLAEAYARLAPGGRMLLQRGGVWTEPLPRLNVSGITIGAYGDGPRPIIEASFPIRTQNSDKPLDDISIVGIHLRAPDGWHGQSGDAVGIWIQRPGDGFLIEDCLIEGFANNVVVQGMLIDGRTDLRIIRSVLSNPYRIDSGCTNVYIESVNGITIDGCAFVSTRDNDKRGSMVSHNVYIHESCGTDDVIVTGSLFYNARTNLTMRTGGRAEGNLLIRGGQGVAVAVSRPHEQRAPVVVRGNVIAESRNHWDGQPLGLAIDLGRSGESLIDGNIIFNGTDGGNHNGVILSAAAKDTMVSKNIVYGWGREGTDDWYPALRVSGYSGYLKVEDNAFVHAWSQWIIMATADLSGAEFHRNSYHTPRGSQAILDTAAGWQAANWSRDRETDAVWLDAPPEAWPDSLADVLGMETEAWVAEVVAEWDAPVVGEVVGRISEIFE